MQTRLVIVQTPLAGIQAPLARVQTRLGVVQSQVCRVQSPLSGVQSPVIWMQRPGDESQSSCYSDFMTIRRIGSPRVARAQKKTATELLEAEFARADMLREDRIDGLMEQFKESGASFSADYKNARRIVDTGGSSSASPTPPPGP